MGIIVGIAGCKDSVKSTAAQRLVDNGFVRLSFADAMHDMLVKLLLNCGYDMDSIRLMLLEDKERVIPELGKSPQELLQTLGTQWGRCLVNKDLWVMAAHKRIKSLGGMNIVFDDVRFENEAAMIRNAGGLIIHVERLQAEQAVTDYHASEAGIGRQASDVVLGNNGLIEYFLSDVLHAVRYYQVTRA